MYTYYKDAPNRESGGRNPSVVAAVSEIIETVRRGGDGAVAMYNERFGGMSSESFRVSAADIAAAEASLPADLRRALETAAANIRNFAKVQLRSLASIPATEMSPGVWLGQRVIPVDSCCCYIPGGNHPLFSTALMLAIPAKTAGVRRVCASVPPMKGSSLPHPATLAALKIAGVDEIYAIGGAQAIAAFAWGTDSIKAVAKIVGPGNKYVTEAKRQVYGKVGIDFVAGPSEVLVIADSTADPRIIAADLLAQSEHDVDASGILITTSKELAAAVGAEVALQLKSLDTAEIASLSWRDNGRIIVVDSLGEAAELANDMAPEHLEVNVAEPDALTPFLRNYGSLFVGEGSAEVFGDYVAGTNHTLPTMGAARYTGGVSALTFMKVSTFQRIAPEGAKRLAPVAAVMARGEGLSAHARAAEVRLELKTKA